MSIDSYFLRKINIINSSIIIWDKPFQIITTKTTLHFIYGKAIIDRKSQSSIALLVNISKQEEELVAHAKALVEQHDLNLLTGYYKQPITLYDLMVLLTNQLRGEDVH